VSKSHTIRLIAAASAILALSATYPAIADPPQHLPPPARIQPLQLKQPFTLIYTLAVQWDNHGHTVNEKPRLTLSYDGQNLLYTSENMDTHVTRICLYNGEETYIMNSNSGIAEIDPGFDFSRLLFCPLPGVGIPKMPFFRLGIPANVLPKFIKMAAPNVNSEAQYVDQTLYRTPGRVRDYGFFNDADRDAHNRDAVSGLGSVVTVPASGVPKVLWFDTFDVLGKPFLGRLWEYYGHERFQGIWLAKGIRMRFNAITTAGGPIVLLESGTYTLQSAKNQPLEPRAFDPTTYLPKHANITDFTGPTVRTFLYEPGNGSLESQRQRGMDIRQKATLGAKSTTNTGVVGLCILAAGASMWFLWRRGRERV
jgi:hypothetical protein